jgi:hypothetical protein
MHSTYSLGNPALDEFAVRRFILLVAEAEIDKSDNPIVFPTNMVNDELFRRHFRDTA